MRTEREFLIEVLDRLNAAGIDYMLTGSMASNFWGIPRTTHDLDFVLLLKHGQVDSFVAAFEEGCFVQADSVRNVFQPPYQFNVLDKQSALKADFWLLREDPFEHAAFERRMDVEIFGDGACIATAEDVLLHKLYWIGSPLRTASFWTQPGSMPCRENRSTRHTCGTGRSISPYNQCWRTSSRASFGPNPADDRGLAWGEA